MNKFSILVVSVAAAVAFSSCETSRDDNPVLPTSQEVQTVNFLNQPAMQEQYIDLTEANESQVLRLTCSQPAEYTYAASVRYIPQISLTKDFADFRQYDGDWSADCSQIKVTNRNVAEAVCEMLGVRELEDLPQDYYPVYVRLKADVYTDLGVIIPNTTILSNVVEFKHVRVGYLAVWVSDVAQDLYLVGTLPGADWTADPMYQFYTGADKNTWVTRTVTIPAGANFKVSPAAWNAPFNGIAFNAGSNGSAIKVDSDYELYVGGDSSDIPFEGNGFTGVAKITFDKGKYILRLIPD